MALVGRIEEAGIDLFRVPGVTSDRVRRAFRLLEAAEQLQGQMLR